MILPDFILTSRQNQIWSESGIDSKKKCLDRKHFNSYPYEVEQIDWARDKHHYDQVTAGKFVDSIIGRFNISSS